MNKLSEHLFASRGQLDQQLAKDVASRLAAAIAARDCATLVVSGGSTPLNFFKVLSQQQLPWHLVTITLADERWVDPRDDASNEKRVRDNLLVNCAKDANFLPLKNPGDNARDAEAVLNDKLRALGVFDVVILGMGSDGHTASLFPKASALKDALAMASGKNCLAIEPPCAPYQRMTLTLPRLLNSRGIIIHITGSEKKALLGKAQKVVDPGTLPVAFILQQNLVPVSLYWAE
ncbi:MAG: 6-phosphogluconolactonase [Porticoccaceae bacterium]|nr:6-phosphogluconolactonase [Porticoccaceae bacterium]